MRQPEGLLGRHFAKYSEYHQTRGNQISHEVGIPLIVITLLGLLAHVHFGKFDAGLTLWIAIVAWYATLTFVNGHLSISNLAITLPFSIIGFLAYAGGRELPFLWLWAGFVVGWIAQSLGHLVYEKKSPAFFTNLSHLFIGPLWVFAKWRDRLQRPDSP